MKSEKDISSEKVESEEGKASDGYSRSLKSSSIIGGAQGVNYIIGMVRTKLVAILLGPAGVGVIGLYNSTIALVGVLSGLGITSSGVREVALAHSKGCSAEQARTVKVLRRACWVTGLLGWALTASLAWPLSNWVFGSYERAGVVAVIGFSLVFTAISGGQRALLQGMRCIGDLAKLNILSVIASTVVAIGVYAVWGEAGIAPVIISTAVINLLFSWWFAKRIDLEPVGLTWKETWSHSKGLIGVGFAFMWTALLAAATDMVTRALIEHDLGTEANGVYQAAWALSGMFVAFILQAMGADFYPRLTAVSDDNEKVRGVVNEQTEIGILLALPGLLGTLTFAPWLIHIFYTKEFLPAAELLPWFVLGMFCRILGWPMGFVQMAKGATRWMFFSQTHAFVLVITLTYVMLKSHGILGVALALVIASPIQTVLTFFIANRLSQFKWSGNVMRLLLLSVVFIVSGFMVQYWLETMYAFVIGAMLTVVVSIISVRGIGVRLGPENRIVKLMHRVPGGRWMSGVSNHLSL